MTGHFHALSNYVFNSVLDFVLFHTLVARWLLHSQVQLCPEGEKDNFFHMTEEVFPGSPFSCLIGQNYILCPLQTDKGHGTTIINLDQSKKL